MEIHIESGGGCSFDEASAPIRGMSFAHCEILDQRLDALVSQSERRILAAEGFTNPITGTWRSPNYILEGCGSYRVLGTTSESIKVSRHHERSVSHSESRKPSQDVELALATVSEAVWLVLNAVLDRALRKGIGGAS